LTYFCVRLHIHTQRTFTHTQRTHTHTHQIVHPLIHIGYTYTTHLYTHTPNRTPAHTHRLLVFRPFNGEVLVGTVHKSTEQGLWINIGFFQDIYVAPHFLPVLPVCRCVCVYVCMCVGVRECVCVGMSPSVPSCAHT